MEVIPISDEVHLIRNPFRLSSRADSDAIKRDIKPIYTAPNADAALAALDEPEDKWGTKYRAMIRLWRNAWTEFVPFLDYDVEIRKVICSTNARVVERPLPARGTSTWSFPDRAGSVEVPVSCDPQPGPHRGRPRSMDDTLEACSQRLRHHIR